MGLIFVDSSVWLDLLTDRETRQSLALRTFLDRGDPIAIGDLVLMEILQGARTERSFREAQNLLARFTPVIVADHKVAIAAARHYRTLRGLGITIRKTIDTLIATRCILDGLPLLYSDRDFDPFVAHLGLRSAIDDLSGVA